MKIKNLNLFEQVLPVMALIGLCFIIWLIRLPDINWTIALKGWSAIDWVNHLTHPDYFVKDFLNGSELYDKSSFMYIYPLAQKWLGITPESMIPAVVLFEVLFLAACGFYLFRSIVPKTPIIAACVFSMLLVSSLAGDMDLSKFGAPFFWGLFYNVADGLRLLAIALAFRKRWLASAVALALSATVHPIIAIMGMAFIFGSLIIDRRGLTLNRFFGSSFIFFVISISWLFSKLSDASISSGAINQDAWISMVRMFSYHFFPIDIGMFSIFHDRHLVPLFGLLTLASFYLPRIIEDYSRQKAILMGLAILLLLIIAGFVISYYYPSPFLIKLALHRACGLFITILLAIVVAGLFNDVMQESVYYKTFALVLLLSPFMFNPGFPVAAILAISLPRLFHKSNFGLSTKFVLPMVFSCGIIAFTIIYWSLGVARFHNYPAYFGGGFFWTMTILIGVFCLGIMSIESVLKNQSFSNNALKISMLIVVVFFGTRLQIGLLPGESDRRFGQDYLEVQNWAKVHTLPQSLFMVDPSIFYGWRDFSERSSFGNLREWLHTSWLYDSSNSRFNEGMKRFGEYEIDIEPYLNKRSVPSVRDYQILTEHVKSKYYNNPATWHEKMARKYEISYIVFVKKNVHQSYPFKNVFENNHFVVYQLQ